MCWNDQEERDSWDRFSVQQVSTKRTPLLQNLVLVSTAIIDCQSTHSRTSSISWILGATLKNLSPFYHFELEMEPRNPKNGVKNGLKIPPRRSITGVLRRDHNQRTPPRSDGIVNYEQTRHAVKILTAAGIAAVGADTRQGLLVSFLAINVAQLAISMRAQIA